ncbi:Rv1733c family protein [Qaidamihabitans albus]|uniref:Rv1733c family protein n=1 Tax=Qaidamihabitans albus TaxID=2795733 RepID=UPI0018F1CA15|nr:hypothetical protein [Qaidamihabitans albus]
MRSPDTRIGRWWRLLRPGRNPLARPSDRFEARLLVVLVLLALLAIPVAAAIGSETYTSRLDAARAESASREQVTAELLADALMSMGAPAARPPHVPARWTLPDGTEHTGQVPAYSGATEGTEVTVWVDRSGAVTGAPTTTAGAAFEGVGAGLTIWLGFTVLCGVVFGVARLLVTRSHAQRWAQEWARVEREWSRS